MAKQRSPFETLPRIGLGESYSVEDRQRDFLAVFLGSSTKEQGQRVLAWLTHFCSPPCIKGDADKPGTLAFKEGQRFVLEQINDAFAPKQRVPEIERKPRNVAK